MVSAQKAYYTSLSLLQVYLSLVSWEADGKRDLYVKVEY